MLIIRGVNVFPSQIEARAHGGGGRRARTTSSSSTREGNLDILEVQVEVNESIFSDEIKGLERLARRVENGHQGPAGGVLQGASWWSRRRSSAARERRSG
ncbi:MAG: hypothetical protein M0C28_19320 [Candidatus Moduliflexus flocculans]|nr:hypothetical protein [Candidatus Moduliflexus flocculans]